MYVLARDGNLTEPLTQTKEDHGREEDSGAARMLWVWKNGSSRSSVDAKAATSRRPFKCESNSDFRAQQDRN